MCVSEVSERERERERERESGGGARPSSSSVPFNQSSLESVDDVDEASSSASISEYKCFLFLVTRVLLIL